MKAASTEKMADTDEWKAREEIRLKERELDILEKVKADAAQADNKVTGVVSP